MSASKGILDFLEPCVPGTPWHSKPLCAVIILLFLALFAFLIYAFIEDRKTKGKGKVR